MKTKNIFLYLPLLLALMLGAMGCSSDEDNMEIKGCFSAYVMGVNSDGTVMAQITEAPEGLSNVQPGKNRFVILPIRDLRNPDVQSGDIVDFSIINYEQISHPVNGPILYLGPEFICRVKPCK